MSLRSLLILIAILWLVAFAAPVLARGERVRHFNTKNGPVRVLPR